MLALPLLEHIAKSGKQTKAGKDKFTRPDWKAQTRAGLGTVTVVPAGSHVTRSLASPVPKTSVPATCWLASAGKTACPGSEQVRVAVMISPPEQSSVTVVAVRFTVASCA